jgi:aldose 1-epimerase
MEKIIDGKTVSMFTLKNSNGMSADITNFGAKVVRLFAADRDGNSMMWYLDSIHSTK